MARVWSDEGVTWRAPGTKVAHSVMREVNRSIVLDILREGEPVSRVELARRTHLSKPTVSSIIEDLVAAGLVREVGFGATSHSGRPPSLLLYNDRAIGFAGIQFGVNTTHVAVADGLGRIIAEVRVPAVHGDFEQSVRDTQRPLRQAITRSTLRRNQVRAAGVAVAGMVDAETGTCILAPNLGWHDVAVRQRLEKALRMPVVVAPSTHAAALAELRLSGGERRRGLVWVYAGSGIGCAIVVDGQLFTGQRGLAGEIGHAPMVEDGPRCECGKRGCLETVAAAGAVVRSAAAAMRGGEPTSLPTPASGLTADVVARHAATGDAVARRALSEAGDHLGRGIACVVNLLNPDLVVIGGPLAGMSEVYVEAALVSTARNSLAAEAVEVRTTRLGDQAPLLGVIQLALGAATPSYRVVDVVGTHHGAQ
jgi:predicted NBD/HSP70 family sugar kinase